MGAKAASVSAMTARIGVLHGGWGSTGEHYQRRGWGRALSTAGTGASTVNGEGDQWGKGASASAMMTQVGAWSQHVRRGRWGGGRSYRLSGGNV